MSKPLKLVGALVSGIAILRYLNQTDGPVGVVRIAQDLDLNSSTCFNLLKTLVHERLVVFDPTTKKYSAGLGLLELAHGVLNRGSMRSMLHARLRRIAVAHDVTTLLWQRFSDNRFILVDKSEAPRAMRVQMTIGQRLPALIGAFGRCVAAQSGLDKETVRRLFEELRWGRAPGFEAYWQDVETARRTGYAIDFGNYHIGVTTVASAVSDNSDSPVMAISAIALSSQFSDQVVHEVGRDLSETASEISLVMRGGATFDQAS